MNFFIKIDFFKKLYLAIILLAISASLIAQNQLSLAGAGPDGCKTNPDKDTGLCKKNVNGEEYNCVVKDYSWQDGNCYSD